MAAGSQAEKGIWALLVQAAKETSINEIRGLTLPWENIVKDQFPKKAKMAILVRITTSPTRLVRAVSIPAL